MNKWDEYFFNICSTVASNSKCLSRKIGAIVVKDKSIISTGYNGPPRGVSSCDMRCKNDEYLMKLIKTKLISNKSYIFNINICPRQALGFKSGEGLDLCVAGHGERNALINAAREGVSVKGATMYMNCAIPCTPCLIEIINAGISEIVTIGMSYYDAMSPYLIEQSGLKVRTYDFEI